MSTPRKMTLARRKKPTPVKKEAQPKTRPKRPAPEAKPKPADTPKAIRLRESFLTWREARQ